MLENIDKIVGPAVIALVALSFVCCVIGILSLLGPEKNKWLFKVLFSQSTLVLSFSLMFYLRETLSQHLPELILIMVIIMLTNIVSGMYFIREKDEETNTFLGRYLIYTTIILYTIDAMLLVGFVF